MKKIFSILLFMVSGITLRAQIELNRPLNFTLPGDSARIENLYTPNDSTAGLNAGSVQNNHFLYATATGSNLINLTTAIATPVPNQGMVIYFKAAAANTTPVTISLNGSPVYNLKKNVNDPLAAGDISTGKMIAMAYDGSAFQYLNYEHDNCPTGFIAVTSEYCIEINESVISDTIWNAFVNCHTRDARLCNWGEWYYACMSLGTSLSNMTNNWEYVDDANNEVYDIRICGNGTCKATGGHNILVDGPRKYRCCYSRK